MYECMDAYACTSELIDAWMYVCASIKIIKAKKERTMAGIIDNNIIT